MTMRIAAILACLLLSACDSGTPIKPAPQAGETHVLNVEWRIVDQRTLERVYRSAGRDLQPGQRLHGFAGHLPDGRMVVYTLPPRRVDDDATCTLGHEILHLTHGDYHP